MDDKQRIVELRTALEMVQEKLNKITISNYTTALGRDRGLQLRKDMNFIIDETLKATEK